MDQLPGELVEIIVYYIVALDEFPAYEDQHHLEQYSWKNRPDDESNTKRQDTLAVLRFVNGHFCHVASKLLFRHQTVRMHHQLSFHPQFEALSASRCAGFVQHLRFDLGDGQNRYDFQRYGEADNEGSAALSDRANDHFVCILDKFTELKTIEIYDRRSGKWETNNLVDRVSMLLCNVQLKKVRDLRVPAECTGLLEKPSTNSENNSTELKFIHQLEHVYLDGTIGPSQKDLSIQLDNNRCLRTLGLVNCNAQIIVPQPGVSPLLQLRCLDLNGVKILSGSLLALLKQCKETISVLGLDKVQLKQCEDTISVLGHDEVQLTSASWVDILIL